MIRRRRPAPRAALAARVALVVSALLMPGCTGLPANPYYDASKSHHRPDGFVNNDPQAVGAGRYPWYEMLWRNLRGDFRPRAEPAGGYAAFARQWSVALDPAKLATRPTEPVLSWLGHATMLLQLDGLNVLIDPQFSLYAGPAAWLGARRHVPPPVAVEDLPPIDLVLISHNHYDHLDEASVERLVELGRQRGRQPGTTPGTTRFIVPLGLKAWFDERGIGGVEEIDWWDRVAVGPLSIHLVPAQHWSRRTLWDYNRSLWGGFVVTRASGWKFLYTGDTGYSADFREIRRRFGPIDFVALPVGAYLPRELMKPHHADPDDAVKIVLDLEARQAIGVHWGTFALTQEAFDAPPKELARSLKARDLAPDRVLLFRHGERRKLD